MCRRSDFAVCGVLHDVVLLTLTYLRTYTLDDIVRYWRYLPSDLELKDTTLTSNEVCYLDTRIKNGDSNTPFHLSVYDKRDDFSFRIVNFPHMDSKIPTNPAYGVYISQLVRYVRICTSKLDFIHRLCRLSSRLLHQGFKSTLLRKSFTKFFKRYGAIIKKYGTTLREIRLAIQN